LLTSNWKSYICSQSYPDVLIFFVVGLPLKADSVEDFDNETQARLEEEFNKFGDTLQVHHPF
jgi:hypothetical protein